MTDQCAYADDAIEELLKRCMRLEEENKELKEQLTRAFTLLEETRKETYE